MNWLRALWRFAAGLTAELSDENAYARHLAIHGRAHSAEEWRRFADARHAARFTRPRCC